jgi:hypothetical protein
VALEQQVRRLLGQQHADADGEASGEVGVGHEAGSHERCDNTRSRQQRVSEGVGVEVGAVQALAAGALGAPQRSVQLRGHAPPGQRPPAMMMPNWKTSRAR